MKSRDAIAPATMRVAVIEMANGGSSSPFGSAGGGLAAAQSSWFALLTLATDGGRRGRSFGLVTALSNLGVVVGATLASEIWQDVGIDRALLVAAGFMVLAGISLALVREPPSTPDRPPEAQEAQGAQEAPEAPVPQMPPEAPQDRAPESA